jgi:dihydrofolate reductase
MMSAMGRIVAVENVSLDGVMQAPAGADEDTRGGFDRGGWAFELFANDPEAGGAAMAHQGSSTTGMLFGRRTYEHLMEVWLARDDDNPFTASLRDMAKVVASRDADYDASWPNSTLIDGPLDDAVRQLREERDGDIVILGSGDVVRQLSAAALIDRYVLTILPVVIGSGTKLFDTTPLELTVARTTVSPTGIVTATYDVR